MPMQRRLPKRGFTNPFRVEAFPVNLGMLDRVLAGGPVDVDVDAMRARGLVPKTANVIKVLGNGELTKALVVKAHRFSASALAKLQAAGGSGEVIATAKTAGG
jgi:large subunit ribosomal protein L15